MKKKIKAFLIAGICVSALLSADRVSASSEAPIRLEEQIAKACEEGTVYVVIQNGTGDFTSIQEGVNAAASGDTLLIYPGTYEENVEIVNKTVHLLGTEKDTCIIQYAATQYNAIPLTFSAGRVANLTIYGYTQETTAAENMESAMAYDTTSLESIREWQKSFSGYALHIDDNYTYGKEVYVENCKIISNNNQSIGVGCRGNSKITFENCELISNGSGGCIYFHNTDNKKLGGASYFTMKDCELVNYSSPYVISMHCMGEVNPVYLTFQNVKTSTVVYEDKLAYSESNMNIGFDVDEMNALNRGGMLLQTGCYSSMKAPFITYYDKVKSREYVASMEEGITPAQESNVLPEGIVYLKTSGEEAPMRLPQRKRYVIDIFNRSLTKGDGWCGLDHIYLTPDSYGNTLIEMNYPISLLPTLELPDNSPAY